MALLLDENESLSFKNAELQAMIDGYDQKDKELRMKAGTVFLHSLKTGAQITKKADPQIFL